MYDRSKVRLLIIDDNPAVQRDFEKILGTEPKHSDGSEIEAIRARVLGGADPRSTADTQPHYDLTFASQGEEAFKIVQEQGNSPFSVAFVDIRMPPGWDGVETIQKLNQVDPRIQFVICTAYSDYSWEETVKKVGEVDNLLILKKPFDIVEVRQLAFALTKKWLLNHDLTIHINNLERLVKERTQDLENSISLMRATLESTADGILVVDRENKIVDYNDKFVEMFEMTEEMLEKTTHEQLKYVMEKLNDPKEFSEKVNHLSRNLEEELFYEINFKNKNCFEVYTTPRHVAGKIAGRVFSFRDVTERKRMQRELQHQATHDLLTGLPNRVLLYDRLQQAIAHAKRFDTTVAVLFFDTDKFKFINDTFGHTVGDIYLRTVAKRLETIIRETDTIARFGGDEFVVVLSDIKHPQQLTFVAEKLLQAISEPMIIERENISATASMGISLFPNDGSSVEILIKHADIAMYKAKERRNSLVFFSNKMSQDAVRRMEIETHLKNAVKNNEFLLEYQPIVDLESQKIIGVEALVRWRHPTLGLLPPLEFISVAEETGDICAIGEWVIYEACAQNKRWQDEGLNPMNMAVNISSKQLETDLEKTIIRALNKSGLNPKYLELELTETVVLSNFENAKKIFDRIRSLGVKISIDDFGTGYSGLSYLTKLSIDKIKIDRSFINNIPDNINDAAIINSIITLANSLNIKVLAEGTETNKQVKFLEDYHCSETQGYIFSKPISAKDFSELVKGDVVTQVKHEGRAL